MQGLQLKEEKVAARAVPWLKFHWRSAPISSFFLQDLRFVCSQVETDAKKLVSEVCGANYVTGTDPILIKVSSEPSTEMQFCTAIFSSAPFVGRQRVS